VWDIDIFVQDFGLMCVKLWAWEFVVNSQVFSVGMGWV